MCNIAISCMYIVILFISVGIPLSVGQQSKCSNNKSLSREATWNCVEIQNCKFSNSIPAEKKVSCGAKSICCPEPLPTSNILRPTQAQINEANSIALSECHKYQGYRYHNYTKSGVVPGHKSVEISEFGCIQEIEHFIANGEKVHEREYPFMALLGFSDDVSDGTRWQCGGTLISSQYILTAAHCTKIDNAKTLVKWALLGKLFRTNITPELRYKNLFKVIRRINHPLYKAGKSEKEDNDIALLKLEQEVPLSSSIRPICLYHDHTMANINSTVIVAGWGVKVPGEIESDSLQEAFINVLEERRCIDQYGEDLALQNGFNKTTMICGGDLTGKGRDTCAGDAGGPMLVPINNYKCMFLQVGIVFRGPWECGANDPAIYTRISYYLPWIRSIVW